MMRGAGLSSRKSEFILNVSLCVCVCVCFAGFFSGCFEFQRIFVSVFGYGIRVAIGMRVDVE